MSSGYAIDWATNNRFCKLYTLDYPKLTCQLKNSCCVPCSVQHVTWRSGEISTRSWSRTNTPVERVAKKYKSHLLFLSSNLSEYVAFLHSLVAWCELRAATLSLCRETMYFRSRRIFFTFHFFALWTLLPLQTLFSQFILYFCCSVGWNKLNVLTRSESWQSVQFLITWQQATKRD